MNAKTNFVNGKRFRQFNDGGFILAFKRVIALLLATGAFGMVAAAPMITLRAIPTAACITPTRILYEKHINASGTIEAREIKEVYLETPVIAQAVNVSVGDYVHKDQVIAVIDTSLTKSVLEQSVPASDLLDSLPSAQEASELLGLYSALEASGLTSGFGGISGLGELAEVFGSTDTKAGEPKNEYLYIPQVVTAPMSGVVTDLSIKSDVLSRTAKPIVTIADTGSFIAKVSVGESYVSDLRVGDPAVIEGSGFSQKYEGHVSRVYPTARKTAGTTAQETVVDLEIAIDDPDDALKTGFTARAEITTGKQKEMLVVPYEAVLQDTDNVEYVYLVKGSRAVRRDIETGMELLEGVEVREGLTESDVILKNAADGLAGDRIQLKRG